MSNEPDVTIVCSKCMSTKVRRFGLQTMRKPDDISPPVMGTCLKYGEVYDTAYGKEVMPTIRFFAEDEATNMIVAI